MVAFIIVSWMPPAVEPIMLIMLIIPVDSSVVEGFTWMLLPSSVTRYSVKGVLYSYWMPLTSALTSSERLSSYFLKLVRLFSVTPLIQPLISLVMRLPE